MAETSERWYDENTNNICTTFTLDMWDWLWQVIDGKILINNMTLEQVLASQNVNIKIKSASAETNLAVRHAFNDAECIDENGKEQKVFFEPQACFIYDGARIPSSFFSAEHISKDILERTKSVYAQLTTYWQKQKLAKIHSGKSLHENSSPAPQPKTLPQAVPATR